MGKFVDLTGQKFNRLTVLGLGTRNTSGQIQWRCKCDCGNIVLATTTYLKTGHTKSCVCYNRDIASNRLKEEKFIKAREKYRKNNFLKDGTSLALLKKQEPNKNNGCNVRGVYWQKDIKKWRARIYFKGKEHYLGVYSNLEDAIKARQKAEDEFFKPIINKYED